MSDGGMVVLDQLRGDEDLALRVADLLADVLVPSG
jgi:hypothetical protein